MSTLPMLLQVWETMLYLSIWNQNLAGKIWHQNIGWGERERAAPLGGTCLQQGGISANCDMVFERGDGTPWWTYLLQGRILYFSHSRVSNSNNINLVDITKKWVVNMSSYLLKEAQTSLLAREPKSVVIPRHPQKGEYIAAVEEICPCLLPKWQLHWKLITANLWTRHTPRPNVTLQKARAIMGLKPI